MKIEDYADVLNLDLVVRRYANQGNRYCAKFDRAEIKDHVDSVGISSTSGNARSLHDAVNDYIAQIRGKRIVIDALRESRREYDVPQNLEYLSTSTQKQV
jgi:hypothetical protein